MSDSKFFAICSGFCNTTGAATPNGVQRTSLLNAPRTRDTIGTGGVTLAANAPDAFTPLYQGLMQQRLSADGMLRILGVTCEKVLSTEPDAPTQAKDSSAPAPVSSGHDSCTSCKGTGRAIRHADHKYDDTRPDWSQFIDSNKRPPADVRKPKGG